MAWTALYLLGREVGRSAEHLTRGSQRRQAGCTGDAEVGDLDEVVVGDEQVAGREVAVDDTGLVSRVHSSRGLTDEVSHPLGRQRAGLDE